jgi:dipeptidyl aminopeptidase/acylaminoacyl peptidase
MQNKINSSDFRLKGHSGNYNRRKKWIIASVILFILFFSLPLYAQDTLYIPDIETFMQIGYADSPRLTKDGEILFFETGFTGVDQLYSLDSSGWPYQLTFLPDGINFYSLSPDGKKAIVGASRGGDEQAQFFLLDTRTGQITQLTNRPEVRHGGPTWSPDNQKIYFFSNQTNLKEFHIFSMDLKTKKQEMVFEFHGWNSVADISDDGRYLLVYHFPSNINNDVYLVDLTTLKAENITPHEGDYTFEYANFSKDAKTVYLVSNMNEDGIMRLAKIDLATKKLSFWGEESKWGVEGLSVSPDRKYLGWVVNEEGYGKLKLWDLERKKELPVPDLKGRIRGGSFSNVGSIAIAFTSPTRTTDIWIWDWKKPELRKVTHSVMAGIDPSLFVEPTLIKYKSFDGLEIPAFLYLPANYQGKPIPFVIHAHGGPESQYRPGFARHFQYLLLNGYGIFAPNIRGSSGYGKEYVLMDNYKKRLDSIKDIAEGARWLIKKGYTSPDRLAIKGGSYGGYAVMAAITEYPDLFAAGIEEIGIVNFVTFLENTRAYRRKLRESEYGPLTDREFLKSISPIHKVDKIKAALLVIHGENDPRVPVTEARQVIEAVKAQGGEVDSLIFPDEGHGIAKLSNRLVAYRKMVDFLDAHLKKD